MTSPGTSPGNTYVNKARCSQELKHKNQNATLTRKSKPLGTVEWRLFIQHERWGIQHSLHHATVEKARQLKLLTRCVVNGLSSTCMKHHHLPPPQGTANFIFKQVC